MVTTVGVGGVDALPVNFDLQEIVHLFEDTLPTKIPLSSPLILPARALVSSKYSEDEETGKLCPHIS